MRRLQLKNIKLISFVLVVASAVLGGKLFSFLRPAGESHSSTNAAVAANGFLGSGDYESTLGTYDLGAHQTLSRVVLLLRENYVDPARVSPYDMFIAALDYMEKTVPEVIVDSTAI